MINLSGKSLLPWAFTVPLLVVSFISAICFRGTDSVLFLPNLGGIIVFGVIVLWSGFKKGWSLPRSSFNVFVGLYWIYVLLSVCWSTVPYNSTLFALIFSVFPFVFFVCVLAQNREKWLVIHIGVLGAVVAGLSIWALIQFIFLWGEYGPRIHHPMLNPNNLAVLFNMCLFPAMALYFKQKKRLFVVLTYGLVMLYFTALMTTQSRGAVLSFTIAMVIFMALTYKGDGVTWRKIVALLLGGGVFVFAIDNISMGSVEQGVSGFTQGDHSIIDRYLLWNSTWDMIKDNFWLGTGLGTFYYYYPKYRSPGDMSDGFFTHMDPLQFWAEMGVLSFILFYAILLSVFVLTIKALRVSAPESSQRLWLVASFCALLVLAGHSHISFHLYMPAPLLIAGFIMAFWYRNVEKILDIKRIYVRIGNETLVNWLAKIALILIFSVPMLWIILASAGVHYAGKASVLLNSGKREESYENIVLARHYAPSSWYKPYDLLSQYFFYTLSDRKSLNISESRVEVYGKAMDAITHARRLNPPYTALWNRQARLHFMSFPDIDPKGRDKAIELLNDTIEANPLLVDARLGLFYIYTTMGEQQKALSVLEEALIYPLPIGPLSVNLYNSIAGLRLKLGDRDGYNKAVAQAKSFKERYENRKK